MKLKRKIYEKLLEWKEKYSKNYALLIVDVFKSINEKIFANIKENSRLSLLRDTLLPRLMSGELEVPE